MALNILGWFRKKTAIEKLQDLYKKELERFHQLSTIDRAASDRAYAEAQRILQQIQDMEEVRK